MFESTPHPAPDPEVIARFDAMAEAALRRYEQRTPSAESLGWMGQISGAVRIENRAAAAQLVAIGRLFAYRLSQCSENEDWRLTRWRRWPRR